MPGTAAAFYTRWLARIAIGLAALLLSIGISYSLTRYAAQGLSVIGGPGEADVTMARDARELSNALVFWGNDFFTRFPPTAEPLEPGATRWASRALGDQLDHMLDDSAETDYPHPVWRDLVAAVYRCQFVMRQPENASARISAAAEIRAAVAQCETWIAAHGIDRRIDQSPEIIRF